MHDPDVVETEKVRALRCRRREEGAIFRMQDTLAVFDPALTQEIEAANYADLTMLDGFADTVLGSRSAAVSWSVLRAAWSKQMRHLTTAESLQRLCRRMEHLLDAETQRHQDLVWLAERAIVEPLVPMIVAGLAPAAERRLLREIRSKVAWVLSDIDAHRTPRGHKAKMTVLQIIAGLEIRRELKDRARGRKPRQCDLIDPLVDLLPELGTGRAVDAATALLTAITGSPGAAAACLLFELNRHPEWQARLEAEFAAIPADALYRAPTRAAPLATAFVKEILRIWSSPPFVTRPVRADIRNDQVALKFGERYLLSSYMIHHEEADWRDADVFDPQRWLGTAREAQCPHGQYVPFGWAPKSCIGANLGMAQLILFAHLVCTRYRVDVAHPERAKIAVASVVRPMDFAGALSRR